MAVGPKFAIDDVVYIIASASLGDLEAYKVGAVHQRTADTWVYQIFIEQKPPHGATVGGRIDLKSEPELFYTEAELTTLCIAVDITIGNLQARMNSLEAKANTGCMGVPLPEKGNTRFDIDDTVFVRASAKIGFLEDYGVTNIHKRPNVNEFVYELDIKGKQQRAGIRDRINLMKVRQIFFKERELLDECEALDVAIQALDRKVARMLAIKLNLCTEQEPTASSE